MPVDITLPVDVAVGYFGTKHKIWVEVFNSYDCQSISCPEFYSNKIVMTIYMTSQNEPNDSTSEIIYKVAHAF